MTGTGTRMDFPWHELAVAEVRQDVMRNIVSLRVSQDLFDDLTDDPAEAALAQQVELQAKPPAYQSARPVIDRPFEDAQWFSAIQWPFESRHWTASRFSDGRYGVWYGADTVETSVRETVYHWVHGLLSDAGFEREAVVAERRVHAVACEAMLLDLRRAVRRAPAVVHPTDYASAQAVGARLQREGHPGLVSPSVRHAPGLTYAVFNPAVLSNPRVHGHLTYRLQGGQVVVEQKPGRRWLTIDLAGL